MILSDASCGAQIECMTRMEGQFASGGSNGRGVESVQEDNGNACDLSWYSGRGNPGTFVAEGSVKTLDLATNSWR
jgi:hypothetical protein